MPNDDTAPPETYSRLSTFGRFHQVARRYLKSMDELVSTLPPAPPYEGEEDGPSREAWDLWSYDTHRINEMIDEQATITIIFACAACELYINDAAARLLGDTYFRKHIDRLDLLSKWIIVPRLICGHQIDRGGRAYNGLKSLVGLRNELMHPKSIPFSLDQLHNTPQGHARSDAARDAVETLDTLGKEAEHFDKQVMGMGLLDDDVHSRHLAARGHQDS